jgi:hypothetical protein
MATAPKPLKTPFTNMSFTPDIPSVALQPGEYNYGKNVETDVRAINSVLGDQPILNDIPGNAIFITAGFRVADEYWYVVATREGRWYGLTANIIVNITPGYDPVTNPNAFVAGYTNTSTITDTWNGNVLFINDDLHPPMYLLPEALTFKYYSNDPNSTTDYIWNYNPEWKALTAGFMRLFSTPTVGSILIAGDLTATNLDDSITSLPNTVRWSQSFGLNSGPETWAPTITNIANELEVPVRGPVVDGFPCNGNFYVCSYWDTVVFSPLSYQSTRAPILGVKLLNQGRGLLNENCWANADNAVYGVDARDIWVFNGSDFKSLGNQRVKDYFYANLNPLYTDLTQVTNNTSKNQIEIYYADLDSTGLINQMLAYRYDLGVFQPPRTMINLIHATEGPKYYQFGLAPQPTLNGAFNLSTRTGVWIQGDTPNSQIIEKDIGTTFIGGIPIDSEFRRDNITFSPDVPYSNEVMIHRIFPEIVGTGGNISIAIGGAPSTGATPTFQPTLTIPIDTDKPWVTINQNTYRCVSLIVSNTSDTDSFSITAIDWQIDIVSEAR